MWGTLQQHVMRVTAAQFVWNPENMPDEAPLPVDEEEPGEPNQMEAEERVPAKPHEREQLTNGYYEGEALFDIPEKMY